MRTPRRNFVVEYKTTRRLSKAQPKSIWGNLDLQAVARAVETDDALPQAKPKTTVVPAAETTIIASDAPHGIEVRDPVPVVFEPQVKDPDEPTIDADQALSAKQETVAPSYAPEPRPRKRRTRPSGARPSTVPGNRDLTVEASGAEDELAALEAENLHLKRLMIAKLRAENRQLLLMLQRCR